MLVAVVLVVLVGGGLAVAATGRARGQSAPQQPSPQPPAQGVGQQAEPGGQQQSQGGTTPQKDAAPLPAKSKDGGGLKNIADAGAKAAQFLAQEAFPYSPVTKSVAGYVGAGVALGGTALAGGVSGLAAVAAAGLPGLVLIVTPFLATVMAVLGIISAIETTVRNEEMLRRYNRIQSMLADARAGRIGIESVWQRATADALEGYPGMGFKLAWAPQYGPSPWMYPATTTLADGTTVGTVDLLTTVYTAGGLAAGDEYADAVAKGMPWFVGWSPVYGKDADGNTVVVDARPSRAMRSLATRGRWTPELAARAAQEDADRVSIGVEELRPANDVPALVAAARARLEAQQRTGQGAAVDGDTRAGGIRPARNVGGDL